MPLTLYYHPLSSYCHKVLIALYESSIGFTPHPIDLGKDADRALLSSHWPLCKFPVLLDMGSGRSLPESTTIIEYLALNYASARELVPAEPQLALEVRHWDRIFDNYVHTPMQRIVADRITQMHADLADQRALLRTAYGIIDTQLESRLWAAGQTFSLADCAAAPALFYASTLEPFSADKKALNRYFDRLMNRPAVMRTLEQAKPYFQYYPFSEAIPARFRDGDNAV